MAVGGGRRARGEGGLTAWPGYVDALATLLMVLIFVLLVFVLAQGFLSVALSSRDRALDRLNRQVAELAELLALERGQAQELRTTLARATDELRVTAAARDVLATELREARDARDRSGAERDTALAERDRLSARIVDLELAARAGAERLAGLETQLAEALRRAEAAGGESVQTVRRLAEATRGLSAAQAARSEAEARAGAIAGELAAARLAAERQLAEAQAASERQLAEARGSAERQLAEARAASERQQAEAARILAETRADSQRQLEETRATFGRQLADAQAAIEARRSEAVELLRQLQIARAELSETQRRIAAMREEIAALNTRAGADRATIETRVAELARLAEQTRALTALRDQLERQAREADARAALQQQAREAAERSAAEQQQARQAADRSAAEQAEARRRAEASAQEAVRLGDSARAQVALLNRQLEELRRQLSRIAGALDTAETEAREKDQRITELGARLNAALAAQVEELRRYRSDFFGRLRGVLGERPGVRTVGDRFVFQSEVLFPLGSAEPSAAGQQQIREIARVLKEIAAEIPPDVNWALRVDGHADRTPLRASARFPSNWELAAARAIAVAQILIAEGLPADRVAATSFGDNQPIDPADTPEAYARNRRIELRLTDR